MPLQHDWLEQKVRASSIKDALDCAMRYEAKHIIGVRMPSSGVSHLGTAIHAGTAAYDKAVTEGRPISHNEAVDKFVETVRMDHNPEEPQDDGVKWDEDLSQQEAEAVGTVGVVNYIEKIGQHRKYAAVEAKLNQFPVDFHDVKVRLLLTGTTDRIRYAEGAGHGITDIKSGKTRVTKDGRVSVNAEKAQLAVYELIAEHATGLPITEPAEIAGVSTAKHASVATVTVPGTREALVGSGNTPGVLDFLARMLRTGIFPPNPSSYLCSPKFCPIHARCPYKD